MHVRIVLPWPTTRRALLDLAPHGTAGLLNFRLRSPSTVNAVPDGREVSPAAVNLERFRGALAVVILPTLNEEAGLARTLHDLPFDQFFAPGRRIETLVIDGGSTDRTLDVAREWNVPVLTQTSAGKGGAMLEAVEWVHRLGIPYVVVLDADATYPPDRILPALDLLRGGTDLVIGVRHPVWGPPSDLKDLVHRVGNLVLSLSASLLTHRSILDLCSGFWGVSTERFMALELNDTSFAIEAELVLKSVRRGYSIQQIPVDYHERIGQAKLRALRDGGRILRTIFQEALAGSESAPVRPSPSTWGRDLLSIGLTLGSPGASLEPDLSDVQGPQAIVHYLQRNLPGTEVQVGIHGGTTFPTPAIPPGDCAHSADTESFPSSDVRPLPGLGGGLNPEGARSATISIRSQRRRMLIALPSSPGTLHTPPAAARSGGWSSRESSRRTRHPSLLVLTSRLNFEPERQQQTLFAANGFHFADERRSSSEQPGGRADASVFIERSSPGGAPSGSEPELNRSG